MNMLLRHFRLLAAALLLLSFSSCLGPPPRDYLAVVGAHWLDANGNTIHDHCMVVVKEGKYTALGSQAMIPLPKTAQVVDGLGKYLLTSASLEAPKQLSEATNPQIGADAGFVLLSKDPRQDSGAFSNPSYQFSQGKGSGSLK
jgi:hypothetical protein